MIGGWMKRKECALFITKLGWPITAEQLAKMAQGKTADAGPPCRSTGWRSIWYHEDQARAWALRKIAEEEARQRGLRGGA